MERIAVYGAGTIGSCQATLIIGNGLGPLGLAAVTSVFAPSYML